MRYAVQNGGALFDGTQYRTQRTGAAHTHLRAVMSPQSDGSVPERFLDESIMPLVQVRVASSGRTPDPEVQHNAAPTCKQRTQAL